MHSIDMKTNRRLKMPVDLFKSRPPAYVPRGWLGWAIVGGFFMAIFSYVVFSTSCAPIDVRTVDPWNDPENVSFSKDGNP